MFSLSPRLRTYHARIERELQRKLPRVIERPQALHRAMRYSVLAHGKRIRPLLCVTTAAAEGGLVQAALPVAAALECLHTYTLIHDDLPAMDDDTLRRGKPTNHVIFGEATAILAGDALLTLAFELLSKAKPKAPYAAADLVRAVAQAAGSRGVVGGQAVDIASEGKKSSEALLTYIHQHKTADLLCASLVAGGMMAGVKGKKLKLYNDLGLLLGNIFQMTDDLLNETSTAQELGKAVKSDKRKKKVTGVELWGVAGVRNRIQIMSKELEGLVVKIGVENSDLGLLIKAITERTS